MNKIIEHKRFYPQSMKIYLITGLIILLPIILFAFLARHLSNQPTKIITTDMPKWKQVLYMDENQIGMWWEDNVNFQSYKWNPQGNTTSNQVNSAIVAVNGQWKVYVDGGYIYRVKNGKPDSTKKLISQDDASDINVVKDGIVYLAKRDEGRVIRKISFDGDQATDISVDKMTMYVQVSNDWIYYTNENDYFSLYRIKTDGTGREKVLNEPVFETVIDGNNLYFTKGMYAQQKGEGIYKLDLTTRKVTQITTTPAFRLQVADKWIYFDNDNLHEGKFYRIPKEGGTPEKLTNDDVSSYYVIGNTAYVSYNNLGIKVGFYKLDLVTKKETKISDVMYFNITYSNGQLYMIDDNTMEEVRYDLTKQVFVKDSN